MRERPDVQQKRIDLSVPQVAGSAVAAVVAAKLASSFGVYGTILGAGVVSVIATCGGSVFQHFFKRTGEQIRDATVVPKVQEQGAPAPGEFTEGTVHRARVKSWKRPLVAAALVFGVTLGGITAYELVSGNSFSGDKGTTVSDAFTGGSSSSGSDDSEDAGGSGESGAEPPSSDSSTADVTTPASSGTPSQSASDEGGTTAATTPTPSATDSASPAPTPSESATTPTPSASSRSGTADPDQADPAAQ
ncbi:hypothetical protein AB0I00_36750 [Streptomyces sp. NPDC050803]|uniref:hypothetical protein n=1 Tax=unclassified Streptomyces TaxID=2593676 RepID=UPI003425E351